MNALEVVKEVVIDAAILLLGLVIMSAQQVMTTASGVCRHGQVQVERQQAP